MTPDTKPAIAPALTPKERIMAHELYPGDILFGPGWAGVVPEPKPAIQPALTPEDWKDLSLVTIHTDLYQLLDGNLRIYPADAECAICDPPARHAAAALALHEQEFGFERADVDELLRMAEDQTRGSAAFLRDLAERIAALLPPME